MPRLPQTLGELLVAAGNSRADVGLRILDRDLAATWLPWRVVVQRAAVAAAWLRSIGIKAGDRVALVFPTAPSFFDAFFGTVLAGAIPAPIYPPVRLGRLQEYRVRTAQMLRSIDARLLLSDRRAYRILGEVALEARPPLGCRVLPDFGGGDIATRADSVVDPLGFSLGANSLALIQFSSGTTVTPKPVALSHEAVLAQARALNGFWPDSSDFRNSGVSWLPLYHDMGLIGCVFTALERPGTLTVLPPELFVARPAVWLQTISKYRASISPAPNFAYNLALTKITDEEMDGVDLSSWKFALCGAETVVPDVMRSFGRRFARWHFAAEALTPVYGLSEAGLAVTFSDPAQAVVSARFDRTALAERRTAVEADDGREIVSVGRAVAGFRIRVVDRDGKELLEGRVGNVECSGPSLMEGYFANRDATEEVLRDGWLATGDIGFLYRGDLYITGRAKDMLIIRGANHSPEEVEGAVQSVDGVRAGCVVAVSWLPEGASGEELIVLVEARANVPDERFPDIERACGRAVLAATGLVAEKLVVLHPGTLPRTSSGKLRRGDALEQYLKGTLTPPDATTPVRLAGALARSTLAHLRAKLGVRS